MNRKRALAWGVHIYTIAGGILGFWALLVAANAQYRYAFLILFASFIVDSTDGILARRLKVSEVLPNFSGAHIDDLIDMLTYVYVPLFIIAIGGWLPHNAWLALPLLAAFYSYGQTEMKTEDRFFLGFPNYWNVIALYLYWLQPGPILAVLWLAIPAILGFIPTRYLYPSRNTYLWRTSWTLGIIWFGLLLYLLLQKNPPTWLIYTSLYYPAYYMLASFGIEYRLRTK